MPATNDEEYTQDSEVDEEPPDYYPLLRKDVLRSALQGGLKPSALIPDTPAEPKAAQAQQPDAPVVRRPPYSAVVRGRDGRPRINRLPGSEQVVTPRRPLIQSKKPNLPPGTTPPPPDPVPKYRRYITYLSYILAGILNFVFSIPWTTIVFIATDFNANPVDGTVNGISVQSMSHISYLLWTACYSDLHHDNFCVPNNNAIYSVSLTEGDISHETLIALGVICLKVTQFFAALFSAVIWIAMCLKKTRYNSLIALPAMICIALVTVSEFCLFIFAKSVSQSFGPDVATNLIAGFWLPPFVGICLAVGMGCQFWNYQTEKADKKKQDDAKKKDEKERAEKAKKDAYFTLETMTQ